MSRIIPKEQLAGYQRWHIGSFDKAGAPTAPVTEEVSTPAESNPAPTALPQHNEETVVTIPLPTAEDLARINEEARTEGYQCGYEEGLAAAKAEQEALTRERINQLSDIVGNLQVSLAHLDQTVADQLLDLSIEIASQVLRSSLKVDKSLLLPTIREALGELPLHHGNISLLMNPADAEALSTLIKEQFTHVTLHIISDSSVTEGGCVVKAGNSEIDASVEMRWRRVLEAIGASTKEWLPNP